MKNTGLFLAVSLVIGSSAIASELDRSAAMAEAKSIAQQLGGALQKELVGAMQTGGPVNAL